jgi:hypothetical protein
MQLGAGLPVSAGSEGLWMHSDCEQEHFTRKFSPMSGKFQDVMDVMAATTPSGASIVRDESR